MKKLLILLSVCAVNFAVCAPAKKVVEYAKPYRTISSAEYKRADIKDGWVKKGSAIYFGVDESQKPAGKFGRLIINKDGKFAFEKQPNKAVKFFGYNGVVSRDLLVKGDVEATRKNVREKVAMTVAQGYNSVMIWPRTFAETPEHQDMVDYLIAELKKNGIYVQLRLVSWDIGQPNYSFERRDEPKFRCLMCDPVWLGYWENSALKLLTRRNPYTGMTLAEDPIVLGVNFFGEMNSGYDRLMMNIPDVAPLGEVEWRKWLKAKYGSIEKLNEEWKQKTPLKSFEDVNIHYRERAGRPTSDWYRFISYKHEKFNTFCRGVIEKAGYKGLVWEGDGSRRMSEILPRGTTSDIVPIDIYYCHPRGGWGRVGNSVGQESAISRNGSYILTTLSTKINDRPLIVTEHNYCFWNPHVYEGGLLMPAYGAFQGFSQFLVHVNPVTKAPKSLDAFGAGGSPIMRANEVLTYLLFFRGDVSESKKRADLVMPKKWFDESRVAKFPMNLNQAAVGLMVGFAVSLPDVERPQALKNSAPKKADIQFAPSGFASIYAQDWFTDVERSIDGQFNIANFTKLMRERNIISKDNISDPANGIFQTDTGEITMRAKEKLLKIITPRTEAVAISANKSEQLKHLKINSTSVDGCIALSSVDGKNIPESSRLLLIYTTEAQRVGTVYSAPEKNFVTLVKNGKGPICLKIGKLDALAKLASDKKFVMYPLHSNGERREKIYLQRENGFVKIDLDTSTLQNGTTVFFEIVAE